MQNEIGMGERAKEILLALANQDIGITHVQTDMTQRPQNDHQCHTVLIRTDRNYHLTFVIEGRNIATVLEVVDFCGRRLIGKHNPLAVIDWVPGHIAAAIDRVLMAAIDQIMPAQ